MQVSRLTHPIRLVLKNNRASSSPLLTQTPFTSSSPTTSLFTRPTLLSATVSPPTQSLGLITRTFSTSVSLSMTSEFRLKDAPALSSLDNGAKVEVEVEGLDNAKVLLVQLKGKTHAIGPKCTHFGAPLKSGVLNGTGRLVCPWHGACFNVGTGDVEDAPAPDGLATFELVEKNGGVYVKGEESLVKSGRRAPAISCKAQGQEKIVIVGGGSGTFGTVQALRENNFQGAITIISREPNLPIDRTKLSKALIPDAERLILRPQSWYDEAGVSTVSDEVTSIDFDSKTVVTRSGTSHKYTTLVLATGGTPRGLPLVGFKDNLSNIFKLRTVADVQSILAAVGEQKGKNIVIIGSSFIGMEVGNVLASDNRVSIIGMESAPLERVMGAQVGQIFQGLLSKKGIKFHMSASVDSALPSKETPSAVGAVKLKDGTELPADLVILGVGVAPETSYLKDNPRITLLGDGSVRTDASFAVQGVPSVYAIGDMATFPYHGPGGDGSPTRIEHWNVAQNSGRSVAHTLANPASSEPKSFIPIFWSALGSQLRYCGNTPNGWDKLVLKGNPDDAKFAAFYCKGETVVAVATMMMDPVMTKCSELMRLDRMPSMSDLKAGKDVLEVSLL